MDPNASNTFGDLLRRYRLAAGLTQEELAAHAQVSPRAISDLERGQRTRPWRDTVQLLAVALQLQPEERARLEAAARQVSPPSPAVSRGVGQDAPTPRHNLPVHVTSFVGREREVVDVERRLNETHLLTLTGTGGCGKTRIALQVAEDLANTFPDGVWLVELAPLDSPALVPGAVASVLGVRETSSQPVL